MTRYSAAMDFRCEHNKGALEACAECGATRVLRSGGVQIVVAPSSSLTRATNAVPGKLQSSLDATAMLAGLERELRAVKRIHAKTPRARTAQPLSRDGGNRHERRARASLMKRAKR